MDLAKRNLNVEDVDRERLHIRVITSERILTVIINNPEEMMHLFRILSYGF